MISKSLVPAMTAALLLMCSCARVLPWRDEPPAQEVNLAFTLERNLVELQSLRINDQSGRFILGSAAPRTILDPAFRAPGRQLLQIGSRETVDVDAASLSLGGVADAVIGADAWRGGAVSIDYHSGLVTYQKNGIHRGLMKLYNFDSAPMIYVNVNGRDVAAIVDTSSPDTLVLPSRSHERGNARVSVAGTDFGTLDVQYANIPHARVGNRVLAHFLVSIDYGKKVVGLWRDPRIPM